MFFAAKGLKAIIALLFVIFLIILTAILLFQFLIFLLPLIIVVFLLGYLFRMLNKLKGNRAGNSLDVKYKVKK